MIIIGTIIITLVTIICYSNTLKNDFTLDDHFVIEENKLIRNLDIKKIFSTFFWPEKDMGKAMGFYRPVIISSFALDYFIWGLNPRGYHISNLIFHLLTSLLVFYIALFIFKESEHLFIASLITGLIFSVHTVHTDAVSTIAARTDVMCAFFYLLSLTFLLLDREKDNMLYYYISIISFISALFSKEMAITLPIMAILMLTIYFKEPYKKYIKYYFGYAAGICGYIIMRAIVLKGIAPSGGNRNFGGHGFLDRLIIMLKVIAYYIQNLFFPVKLSPYYDTFTFCDSIFNIKVMMSIIILIICFYVAIKNYRLNKIITISIIFFFVTILPVTNIIPIGILLADRFLYLPSFGYCLFIGGLISNSTLKNKHYIIMLSTLIIMFLFISTVKRNNVWRNDKTLWEETLRLYPESAVASYDLGCCYMEDNNYINAIELFKKAISIDNNYYVVYGNLALAYQNSGNAADAIKVYNTIIERKMPLAEPYINLGSLYIKQSDYNSAERILNEAIKINPGIAEAYENLSEVYKRTGKEKEAISLYKKAISIFPGRPGFYLGLLEYYKKMGMNNEAGEIIKVLNELSAGNTDNNSKYSIAQYYENQENYSEAINEYEKIIKIDPNDPAAYNNLGAIYFKINNLLKAEEMYKKAIDKKLNLKDSYNNLIFILYKDNKFQEGIKIGEKAILTGMESSHLLNSMGLIYTAVGKYDDAISVLKKAIYLDNKNIYAYINLGIAFQKKGMNEEGLSILKKASEIDANHPVIYNAIGVIYANQNKYIEAKQEFEKSLKIDPSNIDTKNNLNKINQILSK